MTVHATAPLWLWNSEKGSWHFVTIEGAAAAELRLLSMGSRGGFGSIKVSAQIGATRWRTSLFPHKESDGFVLPVKAAVRAAESLQVGDNADVILDVL